MRRFYLLAALWALMLSLPTTLARAEGSPSTGKKLTGTIGDFVWRDLNSNGIQDGGEPGLSNVYVELQTSAGGWVNAVFTDGNGAYSFTGVAPGTYKIKFANPGGFFQSPQDATTDNLDSDADINGFTGTFSVAAGQVISNIDAGFKPQTTSTCSLTLTGAAANKLCNDNGTPNAASDDVYTFDFTADVTSNPNGLPVWGYKLQINGMTFYGMYGMPLTVGPLAISLGSQTWTVSDDDNPTCSVSGTVTPPTTCSPGGNCPTSAVRNIINTPLNCGVAGNLYGFWFANLNSNLSNEWLWESGAQMIENSDGTASLIGVIYNKTKVNAKFAVDIKLTGRTFVAPSGSPKTDGACSGTATTSWYYYTGFSGNLTGINTPTSNELAGAMLSISGYGPKPQFGTGASLHNTSANGGSAWLSYVIKMQPVNTSLKFNACPTNSQGGDINIELGGSPLTNCPTGTLTMNCTNNITVTAASGATSAVVNYTAPTATSTCTTGAVSVVKTSGSASGSAFPVGTTTVVYTATDGCGNVKTCSFTVTVNPGTPTCNDVTTPGSIGYDEIGCPSYDPAAIVETAAPTGGSGAFEYVWLSSTTGCPTSSSQAVAGATGPTYDPGPVSQTTWFMRCIRRAGCTSYTGPAHESNCIKKEVKTTGCGGGTPDCNAITITPSAGTLTIGGLTAPITMVQVFNASWAQVFAQNYTSPAPVGGVVSIPSLPAGVYYVKVNFLNASWVAICAKDGYFTVPGGGNPSTLTMTCTADMTVTAATGASSAVVNYPTPTASSTCTTGSVTVVKTSGPASGSAFPVGTTQVCYQATDGCGNVKNCCFNVTVNPGTPSCNISIAVSNIQCDGKGTASTADDTYTFNMTVNGTGTGATWSGSFDNAYLGTFAFGPTAYGTTVPMGPFPAGAFTSSNTNPPVTLTNGLNINIHVNDSQNTACAASTTVNSPGPCSSTGGPDCTAITITPSAGKIDIGGLTAPITMVQVFNASWAQVFSQTYTAPAPVGGTVSIPSLAAGTYYVKVNFLNASWVAICQKDGYFTVPGGSTSLTMTCTADITVTAAQGATSAVVNYATPTATSTCTTGSVTLMRTSGPASGSAFPVGTTQVCYQATDGCGNVKNCCFNVTVNPTAASVLTLTCTNNIVVTAPAGQNSMVVNYALPTATTTCSTPGVTITRISGPASGSVVTGTVTVTHQATDFCGNTKSCSFTITVNPGPSCNPTFSNCPANVVVNAACGASSASASWTAPTASSACGTPTVTSSHNSGASFNVGTTTVTYTATINGLTATCSFTVTVNSAAPGLSSQVAYYSLDACVSTTSNPNTYTEFTASTGLMVTGSIVSNNANAMHSCTPGQSSLGMCTMGVNSCTGNSSLFGSALAFTLTGTASGYLTSLSFYQRSSNPALIYNAASKANNILTKMAVRASIGSNVLYENYAVATTTSWGLVTLNLPNIPVASGTQVKFEIVGFCPSSTNQPNYIFDIDEIKVNGAPCGCSTFSITADNGTSCTTGTATNTYIVNNTNATVKLYNSSGTFLADVLPGTTRTQATTKGATLILKNTAGTTLKTWTVGGCNQTVTITCTQGKYAPAHELTFNAYRKGYDAELKWLNNTGDKNEFFDIERSLDGQFFEQIGRVDGKGGQAGEQLYFQAFDRNPAIGDNIYRLKMVWKDGTVSYSSEQTVRFDAIPAIGLYPNPAADELFVDLSKFAGQKVELSLMNNLGQRVLAETVQKAGDGAHRIDLSTIHSGSYRVFIQPETSRPEVRQVVVEKF